MSALWQGSPDRATEPTETEQLAGIMCLALKESSKQVAYLDYVPGT
jgi:hypothetical protein